MNRRPRAGTTKAAGKGDGASRGANAAPARAQTAEEFLALKPENRAKPRSPAPLPMVLTQTEKDKRAVLQALGHGADGKCPVGVDWRKAKEPFVVPGSLPDERGADWPNAQQAAAYAARNREALYPALRRDSCAAADPFPACGWWWCRERDRLTGKRWAELRKAVDVLQGEGIDPCGHVAQTAGEFAEAKSWAKQWPDRKGLQAYIESHPEEVKQWEGTPAIHSIRAANMAKWAASPKDGGGHAPDKTTTFRLLFTVEQARRGETKWLLGVELAPKGGTLKTWWTKRPATATTPAIAAAILILFGLVDFGSVDGKEVNLKSETHRLENAWPRALRWLRKLRQAAPG